MPTIDLDELVPEDINFTFKGDTYTIPGDLTVDQTFDVVSVWTRAAEAELTGDQDKIRKTNQALTDQLLQLFRIKHPDLESLPFGVAAYRAIVAQVLIAVGLTIEDEQDPPKPSPAPARARSRRSSGSRR